MFDFFLQIKISVNRKMMREACHRLHVPSKYTVAKVS